MKNIVQICLDALIIVGLAGCTVIRGSSPFYLFDSSGKEQGPYEIRHGGHLSIDEGCLPL